VEANGEGDSAVVDAELEEVVLEEVEVWIFFETVLFILKLQIKFYFSGRGNFNNSGGRGGRGGWLNFSNVYI
jgi:hypothetical protein